jgi:hypothetical protein
MMPPTAGGPPAGRVEARLHPHAALPEPLWEAVLAHLAADEGGLAAPRLVCKAWRAAAERAAWGDGRLRVTLREEPVAPLAALLARPRAREAVTAAVVDYPREEREEERGGEWEGYARNRWEWFMRETSWMVEPLLTELGRLPNLVVRHLVARVQEPVVAMCKGPSGGARAVHREGAPVGT